MSTEKTLRVRGKNLIHDGRGYHGLEVDLPFALAEYYIAIGQAELVQSEPASPAPERAEDVPSSRPR